MRKDGSGKEWMSSSSSGWTRPTFWVGRICSASHGVEHGADAGAEIDGPAAGAAVEEVHGEGLDARVLSLLGVEVDADAGVRR